MQANSDLNLTEMTEMPLSDTDFPQDLSDHFHILDFVVADIIVDIVVVSDNVVNIIIIVLVHNIALCPQSPMGCILPLGLAVRCDGYCRGCVHGGCTPGTAPPCTPPGYTHQGTPPLYPRLRAG